MVLYLIIYGPRLATLIYMAIYDYIVVYNAIYNYIQNALLTQHYIWRHIQLYTIRYGIQLNVSAIKNIHFT